MSLRAELQRANDGLMRATSEWRRATDEAQRAESRAVAARSDLVRVAEIFQLGPDASVERTIAVLSAWYEQDQDNRARLAELTEIVSRLEAAEIRSSADHYLQMAQTAFDQGDLENADDALRELEALRRSHEMDARQLWVDAVLARASLADQRRDYRVARDLLRAFRAEERALSNHVQWRALIQEAHSFRSEASWQRDPELLLDAIALLRDEALPLVDQTQSRADWAETQAELGYTLWMLGREIGFSAPIVAAVEAYEFALEATPRSEDSLTWADTHNSLAIALMGLGVTRRSQAWIDSAIEHFEMAAEEYSQESHPREWAIIQNNLGLANAIVGDQSGNIEYYELALVHYGAALQGNRRDEVPLEWAETRYNQALALHTLADRQVDLALFRQSAEAYEEASVIFEQAEDHRRATLARQGMMEVRARMNPTQ